MEIEESMGKFLLYYDVACSGAYSEVFWDSEGYCTEYFCVHICMVHVHAKGGSGGGPPGELSLKQEQLSPFWLMSAQSPCTDICRAGGSLPFPLNWL